MLRLLHTRRCAAVLLYAYTLHVVYAANTMSAELCAAAHVLQAAERLAGVSLRDTTSLHA